MGKSKVRIEFRIGLLAAQSLSARYNNKKVYVLWQMGKKKDNKGESAPSLVKSKEVSWEHGGVAIVASVFEQKGGTEITGGPVKGVEFGTREIQFTLKEHDGSKKGGAVLGTGSLDMALYCDPHITHSANCTLGTGRSAPILMTEIKATWTKINDKNVVKRTPASRLIKEDSSVESSVVTEYGLESANDSSAKDSSGVEKQTGSKAKKHVQEEEESEDENEDTDDDSEDDPFADSSSLFPSSKPITTANAATSAKDSPRESPVASASPNASLLSQNMPSRKRPESPAKLKRTISDRFETPKKKIPPPLIGTSARAGSMAEGLNSLRRSSRAVEVPEWNAAPKASTPTLPKAPAKMNADITRSQKRMSTHRTVAPAVAVSADASKILEDAGDDVGLLRKSITDLTGEVERLRRQQASVAQVNAANQKRLENELSSIKTVLANGKIELDETRERVSELEQELSAKNKEIAEANEKISELEKEKEVSAESERDSDISEPMATELEELRAERELPRLRRNVEKLERNLRVTNIISANVYTNELEFVNSTSVTAQGLLEALEDLNALNPRDDAVLMSVTEAIDAASQRGANDLAIGAYWLSTVISLINSLRSIDGFEFKANPQADGIPVRDVSPEALEEAGERFEDFLEVLLYLTFSRMLEGFYDRVDGTFLPLPQNRDIQFGTSIIPSGEIMDLLEDAIQTLEEQHITGPVVQQFCAQLLYYIDVVLLNELLVRDDICRATVGFQVKMDVSQLREKVQRAEQSWPFSAIRDPLKRVLDACNVLSMTNKLDIAKRDARALRELFPALTIAQVLALMKKFQTDEFVSELTPPQALKRLRTLAKEGSARDRITEIETVDVQSLSAFLNGDI